MYQLMHGDCLELMQQIPEGSIDMVLCDPPYGTTACKWDVIIPFDKLWPIYKRICKKEAAIVLFGQEPFSSFVRMSNIKNYKYDWYWEKEKLVNLFQVKKRAGKNIENVMVFYEKQCVYNPQKQNYFGSCRKGKVKQGSSISKILGGRSNLTPTPYTEDGTRYPTQLLRYNRDSNLKTLHPTQKPVALLEYLIKTYTNDGMTVLDNCMGSGSTGIACLNTNRNFIGIEKDDGYFEIAKKRIENHKAQLSLQI